MYVKVINNTIEKYPYTQSDLLADNPNVSFPSNLTDELMVDWNVFRVKELKIPTYDKRTQKPVQHDAPELKDGAWTLGWNIVDKTDDEIAIYDNQASDFVRSERKRLLQETDWMALSDNTITQEWISYRQALRDITNQPDFPHNIIWPTKPQ